MMNKVLFTIGYSGFTLSDFINVLTENKIQAIADVRSVPFSKYKPEYNSNCLKHELRKHNIKYVFLGDLCGARIDAPECYTNGKVNFGLLSVNPKFLTGIERILKGIEKNRIALLCAEKDPIYCHRMILICRRLKYSSINIFHILSREVIQDNEQCEERLLKLLKMDTFQLFINEMDIIEEAYNRQSEKIAYEENRDTNDR